MINYYNKTVVRPRVQMRKKVNYTEKQLELLKSKFEQNKYPNGVEITEIAEEIGVTTYQVNLKLFFVFMSIN